MRRLKTIGLTLAAAGLLAGCGQKGALYREPAPAPSVVREAPVTQAPQTSAEHDRNASPKAQ